MSNTKIHEEIQEFIGTLNPKATGDIDFSANLLESQVVDSVAMMDLIVWFEEHFNMSIDPEDLTPDNFGSVNAMVAFLER